MSKAIKIRSPKVEAEIEVNQISSVDGDLSLSLQSAHGAVLAYANILSNRQFALIAPKGTTNWVELIVAEDSETLDQLITILERRFRARRGGKFNLIYRSDESDTQ